MLFRNMKWTSGELAEKVWQWLYLWEQELSLGCWVRQETANFYYKPWKDIWPLILCTSNCVIKNKNSF